MQIAYKFDKETLLKIGKGALIALSGAGAIGLLNYIGKLPMANPTETAFIAWLVPTLINIIKEWMSGVTVQ